MWESYTTGYFMGSENIHPTFDRNLCCSAANHYNTTTALNGHHVTERNGRVPIVFSMMIISKNNANHVKQWSNGRKDTKQYFHHRLPKSIY